MHPCNGSSTCAETSASLRRFHRLAAAVVAALGIVLPPGARAQSPGISSRANQHGRKWIAGRHHCQCFQGAWLCTSEPGSFRAVPPWPPSRCLALTVGWTPSAEADITRIVITRVESPTFEGVSFGQVGPYEKLRLRAFGEVDPADPRNHVIADIDLAPRNTRGMVEYDMDVMILKPVTLTNGNRRLFYYMNNRGNLDSPFFPSVGVLSVFNDGSGGNDPTSAAHAGNGFLMRQGYTIVSSGWDPGVAAGGNRLTIRVPVAKNPDGSPVIGPSLEEFVIDNATTVIAPLTYPAAAMDKSRASLTVRTRYDESPVTIPAADWEYVNALSIRLLPAGTPFTQGRLYEFTYPARDPLVAGLGFAATRDLAAFLRYADSDETGTPNPLVGNIERVYTFGISQPARYMRDFLHLGFNEDEQGHRVFDGILNWLGGGSGNLSQLSICTSCTNAPSAHRPMVSGARVPVCESDPF